MPSQKNLTTVKLLCEKLALAKSIVLADYCGLSVNQQRQLRNQVKAVGGELIVAKNSLLKLALEEHFKDLPGVQRLSDLQGPTITLFAYVDEIAPIKALAEFAKVNELPKVKAGFLSREPLSADQINQLAQLPTKVELLTKTVATLKSPLYRIINVLFVNIRNLVYAIKAINNKKILSTKS